MRAGVGKAPDLSPDTAPASRKARRSILGRMAHIPDKSVVPSALWLTLRNKRRPRLSLDAHLDMTAKWLCSAHDGSGDGGVSGWYDLKTGWAASYPETTGYIIPTLLTCARLTGDAGLKERALRMADWEVAVQLPSGAVRSGLMDVPAAPAVFNTGQVILGWTNAYQTTGREAYADAVRRAAEWLVSVQDDDGAWRRHLSQWASSPVQTYNVRTAWALAQAGAVLGQRRWADAAVRNCEWALSQQNAAGWFDNNGFRPTESPLLHTISYAIEGLFGVGMQLGDRRFVDAARLATEGLLKRYRSEGRFHGRYDSEWAPSVYWRCLTGEAQLAGVLLRFVAYADGAAAYQKAAESIIKGICGLQDTNPKHVPTCGGVAGAQPLWGGYLRYRYPNWAAKFHLDALLLMIHDADPHAVRG